MDGISTLSEKEYFKDYFSHAIINKMESIYKPLRNIILSLQSGSAAGAKYSKDAYQINPLNNMSMEIEEEDAQVEKNIRHFIEEAVNEEA